MKTLYKIYLITLGIVITVCMFAMLSAAMWVMGDQL